MIPVCDTSEHQGPINHRLMRSRGVRGLIPRATHGFKVDKRLHEHMLTAREAGYQDRDFGFYPFINPKRGGGAPSARFFVDTVGKALGHLDTFVMYDCESFINEPPLEVTAIRGRAYVDWMHAFDEAVAQNAPQMRRIMYTNASFWNPWTNVDRSFGHLDLVVARYPFYSDAAYARVGYPPPDADQWDEWIMSKTASRPQAPAGWDSWEGWQFAAGYNNQGPVFGCASDDLDLCIMRPDAWARWTRQAQTPPTPVPHLEESDMVIITNSERRADLDPLQGKWQLAQNPLTLRWYPAWVSTVEWVAAGSPVGQPLTNAQYDELAAQTPKATAEASLCLFDPRAVPAPTPVAAPECRFKQSRFLIAGTAEPA